MTSNHPSCDTLVCLVDTLARFAVGAVLLGTGILMTITFWLLPLGVPVGLFGLGILVSSGHKPAPRARVWDQRFGVEQRQAKVRSSESRQLRRKTA